MIEKFGSQKAFGVFVAQVLVLLSLGIAIIARIVNWSIGFGIVAIGCALFGWAVWFFKKTHDLLYLLTFGVLYGTAVLIWTAYPGGIGGIAFMVRLLIALLIILIIIRWLALRRPLEGRIVEAVGDRRIVQIDYDMFRGIEPGEYVVRGKGRRGQKVRIKTKRYWFGRPRPWRVID